MISKNKLIKKQANDQNLIFLLKAVLGKSNMAINLHIFHKL